MIRYFTAHPTAANLVMIGLAALGIAFGPSLLRETFPRIAPKQVQVVLVYPGAAPLEVERALCRPVEDALQGVDNIRETKCVANSGSATLTVEMRPGADLDALTEDVDREISAISSFPDEVEDPIVTQLGRTDFVASVTVTGIDRRIELKSYAEEVAARMRAFGGVPRVEISGFSDRQIRIEISAEAARALGLSLRDVADAVRAQNVELPSGEIDADDRRLVLRFADQRIALDAYRDLVIASSASGAEIRLGDVASIREAFEDDETAVLYNGAPAALLQITKTPGDDTLIVRERIDAFLESERRRAPPGVAFAVVDDMSSIVEDRLNMVTKNAIQGLFLVFLSIWAVFGLRQGIWIAAGLPISFFGAMAAMVWLGYSINMLTMVGFLIVIGILMDDAIVIAENIETKRELGLSPLEAAVQGAREVAPGVVSSFLTTAAIFGALGFLQGDIGEVLSVIPVAMLLVLSVSLIEAFFVLPNHLSHTRKSDQRRGVRGRVGGAIDWMRERIVGPIASGAVRWRYLTLGLAFGAFIATISLFAGGVVKFAAFPEIDGDTIEARISMPPGATLAETQRAASAVSAAAERMGAALSGDAPLIVGVTVEYGKNADVGGSGPHLATVSVDVAPGADRAVPNAEIMAVWRAEIPADLDATRIALSEPSLGPAGQAIELELVGDDLDQLDAAAAWTKSYLDGFAGVENLYDNLEPGPPEIQLRLLEGASALGLSSSDVAGQLSAAFQGVTADEIQIGRETVEIRVALAEQDRDGYGDLDGFVILTPKGGFAPLSSVAEAETTRGWARIARINEQRAVTVLGDVDTRYGNTDQIVRQTAAHLAETLPIEFPGVTLNVGGQNAAASETQSSMMVAVALGLMAVYLILSFQLRSYVEPVTVMIVIPFALVGAALGHLALGYDFSMPSMLGVAALSGIVVNDSILLVGQIKERHDPSDLTAAAAAPKAAKARFRAIFLTSITTILGLLPLLFETSLQAQVLIPLVISIGFGLMATTILILFVVPAFFAVLDDWNLTSLARERKEAARAAAARG